MLEDRVPEELELYVSVQKKQETDDELVMTPSQAEEESDEEILLTPSPVKEDEESDELILEAEKIYKAEEITFDGESESEARIEKAMKEYDAAMDDAAGI